MKNLIVAAAVGLVAVGALAQGQFNFGNNVALSGINAPVFDADGTTRLGPTFLAQAYVKLATDPESSYAPVGAAVSFRVDPNAGYIRSGAVTTTFAGGTAVTVQMRAWEAAKGTTYELAQAAGGKFGKSNDVPLRVTEAPNTPPDMVGLTSFSVIPEPSTFALGVLGAAAFFMRRRS